MTDNKHFVNETNKLVPNSLLGLTLTYPHLAIDEKQKILYVKDVNQIREKQVTLLSGGGSGHEPAHAGYVGPAMLTAAVAGHVFASPTSSQVLSCIRRIYSPKHGTIVIVKNYTGDILNFGRAIERFKSERIANGDKDPKVDMIVVADDVGVINENDDDEGGVGRRGLAGTVLIHKICGALAANGSSIEEINRVAKFVCQNTFTIGCALEAASVPGHGKPRQLQADQLEIGMGIHNEPGFQKDSLQPANALITKLVKHMVESKPWAKSQEKEAHDNIVLLVNNLGAVSNLEMGLVTKEAVDAFKLHKKSPALVYSGAYMTGLAMAGISITSLVLPNDVPFRELLLGALVKPASAPGWINHPVVIADSPSSREEDVDVSALSVSAVNSGSPGQFAPQWETVIESAYHNVVKYEPEITQLDTVMGDGDCGEVLLAGATAIHKAFKSGELYIGDDMWTTIRQISCLVEDAMGGTSGIIYCLFLDGLAQSLGAASQGNPITKENAVEMWREALPQALNTLYKYTSARPGHRTLIDSLAPLVDTFVKTNGDLESAVAEATKGAEATASMKPKRGRAVYTSSGDSSLRDAGAVGLCAVLHGILEGLKQ